MQTYVDLGETLIFVIMGLASVLAVAVFVERLIVYRKSISKETEAYLTDLVGFLRKKDIKSAKELVTSSPDSVYNRFTDFTLERLEENPEGIPVLMEGKILKEKIDLEERLPILNTLGNNAPFIGLLGTVLGVIKAFYSLGTLGNTGSEVVMRSISTALLATAAGLAIAIPVVMANNFFSRKMKVILANLEILSREFVGNFLPGGRSGKSSH
ncbi:MotA/TolQ/ExbB proton channel family protein [Leptospira sp. GIMC2001]|uniref:MotA/TolQ/ExbB proton channel family protein n=1 Tax=Leptospira sp. GIMC2001 TaxID=1513297 RepID=UPI00234B80A5|nr:MotA/TolQ/ExbB proton channel family protein [Leptospira sp. GIMC2001]WCL47694.1 MotA/TolQ/ExbB proton channel family protein [Leptospira sp. GIMC2001]